jgi:hypothetical protein
MFHVEHRNEIRPIEKNVPRGTFLSRAGKWSGDLGPACQDEDTAFAAGEGGRGGPMETCASDGLEDGKIARCGHEGDPAAEFDQRTSRRDGPLHAVDSTEGDAIELSRQGFSTAGVDRGGETEGAYGFPKKCGLLALGLGQGGGDLGAAEGNGDAGKASAGAEVEEGSDAGGEDASDSDRFDKVASENVAGSANSREIRSRIPAKNKRNIGYKCFRLFSL